MLKFRLLVIRLDNIKEILNQLLEKKCSIEEAEKLLKANLIEEVGDFAKLDILRKMRTGIVEVIYAVNKSPKMVIEIAHSFLKQKSFAVISRYTEEQKDLITKEFKNTEQYKGQPSQTEHSQCS